MTEMKQYEVGQKWGRDEGEFLYIISHKNPLRASKINASRGFTLRIFIYQ